MNKIIWLLSLMGLITLGVYGDVNGSRYSDSLIMKNGTTYNITISLVSSEKIYGLTEYIPSYFSVIKTSKGCVVRKSRMECIISPFTQNMPFITYQVRVNTDKPRFGFFLGETAWTAKKTQKYTTKPIRGDSVYMITT
jgi:hypothetical protein